MIHITQPAVRTWTRPTSTTPLTCDEGAAAARLALRRNQMATYSGRPFARWLHNAQMTTTSSAITASDQNG
jgi:hypothetical protein